MKKWLFITCLSAGTCFGTSVAAHTQQIGLVDFKVCVEESKVGKQEQASFGTMKKQMEDVVLEKEKVLNDLASKLNNPDELDLMSPEAETEMKRKFRALSQEMNQIQSQFYETLNQANFKIVQKISELVAKASEAVAKAQKLDLVLNDETCFYSSKELDISPAVIKEMDRLFDEDAKNTPKPAEQKTP